MALLAFYVGVRAFEFEHRKVVIELGGRPAISSMTRGAVRAEPALMRFILAVAGITIGRRFGKIVKDARVDMALGAERPVMFSGQLE